MTELVLISETFTADMLEALQTALDENCFPIDDDGKYYILRNLRDLHTAIYSWGYDGFAFISQGIMTRSLLPINLIKMNRKIELCKVITKILFPHHIRVSENISRAIFSFDSREPMSNGLKCGFYEHDESLAFYVLRLESTESAITGEQETSFIEQNDAALGLSSMCNILEGLHRRITVLERT
jgi:hypothetical protein